LGERWKNRTITCANRGFLEKERILVRQKTTDNPLKMGKITEKKSLHFMGGYGILKSVVE